MLSTYTNKRPFESIMDCVICCETTNKVKYSPIQCPYCNFVACKQCCQHYILDQSMAKCMNNDCNKEWTRKFLVQNFTKSFVSGLWKKNREDVLFDRERALLPATQEVINQRKQAGAIKGEIDEIMNLIQQLCQEKRNLEVRLWEAQHCTLRNIDNASKQRFTRACPDEDCRGFLNTKWKCGTCEKTTCKDCHNIIDGVNEHTCNQDDVETAKLLDKDTKPCPKCATGIYKIDGCDQMWCTQCHTAFSWKTGRIETNVHNPHYFEFMRLTNGGLARNANDHFVCGQELTGRTARLIEYDIEDNAVKPIIRRIGNVVQSVIHLQRVQIPIYQVDQIEDNLELRIQYLNKSISESDFKIRVQRANKKHEKNREMREILDLFARTVTEIILRMVQESTHVSGHKQLAPYLEEIEGIQNYANECLGDIATTYGSKKHQLLFYNSTVGRKYILKGKETTTRDVIASVD